MPRTPRTPEYIPEGYIPPIYQVRERWEIYLWTGAFVIITGMILMPMMLAHPEIFDALLYAAGIGIAFSYVKKALAIFRFNRELKQITEAK